MTYDVDLDKKALGDLRQIIDYYKGTMHVDRFRAKLYRQMKTLETWPNVGIDIGGDFRKAILLKRYVLLYQVKRNRVIIRRIFDGRTDYDKEKEEE